MYMYIGAGKSRSAAATGTTWDYYFYRTTNITNILFYCITVLLL